MELAAEAMRGHRSAHSFATGPVMADPARQSNRVVSNAREKGAVVMPIIKFTPVVSLALVLQRGQAEWHQLNRQLLMRRTLHLALRVDDDAGVVLEVQEHAVLAAPRLPLADDDCWHDCSVGQHKQSDFDPSCLNPWRLCWQAQPAAGKARRSNRPSRAAVHPHNDWAYCKNMSERISMSSCMATQLDAVRALLLPPRCHMRGWTRSNRRNVATADRADA